MIPKILHYIWVGGKPLPDNVKENIKTWAAVNPDFEILQWDESNIDFTSKFIRRSYQLGYWARVADYARLDILMKNGGIYLDTDVKSVKTFQPLLNHSFFAGLEDECGTVNNAVIGAEPDHWFLKEALKKIERDMTGFEQMDSSVGPGLFTSLAKEHKLVKNSNLVSSSDEIFIAPHEFFYPYGYDEEFSISCVTENTVCIHLWEKSWQSHRLNFSGTKKLQRILQNYPSLIKSTYLAWLLEIGISISEAVAGNKRFFSNDLPWKNNIISSKQKPLRT